MITGSKELIRDINSHLVLETILNKGPISRAAISNKLGLTKATISAIVSDLMENQLIREIGSVDTSLGRKPILLEFCKEHGHIISVDLGVNMISVFTSDLKGNHCGLKQFENNYSRYNIIKGITLLIEQTIRSLPSTAFGVVGICLGIHGVIHENQITFTPYYNYDQLPFAETLEEYFHIPVTLENEANLSVLGEKSFCYHVPNMIGISVHSGIGIGIIINNGLYTGFNGNAGEFGHTIVEAYGRDCPCGNKGCLEQYASERAILHDYAKIKGIPNVTIDTFIEKYNAGDSDAADMAEQFIKYISVGINNLLNIFNPEVIVINSTFTMYIPDLIGKIESHLKNRMNKYCTLVPSGLQDTSILLGGVCVCINQFLGVDYSEPNSTFTVG
ncbi:MAG TPA: ROK family transcriptional regulator [Lachnospiraceae bacterium]|nr:ROK family transcriptional regulator [Lachnospiraceae bacterium]